MIFSIQAKEFNLKGETTRDITLMKTPNFDRALSHYNQRLENSAMYSNGRSQLLLMEGDEVRRKFEY